MCDDYEEIFCPDGCDQTLDFEWRTDNDKI